MLGKAQLSKSYSLCTVFAGYILASWLGSTAAACALRAIRLSGCGFHLGHFSAAFSAPRRCSESNTRFAHRLAGDGALQPEADPRW